ncbi:M56 family metallopeptidase [Dawidia soli]|uniref:M48 family metalloprotease n=1 Tax=Dawidia soli TaxID=2782352 RepID=A0AAP2D8M2_9BACT|nr:M56 family metallopeptidase [Dawidia soli]MBT1687523.1 M48 family metalloprotease [Dawidia soli]
MSSLLSTALGWTLIHSLWQALLVYGTVTIVLRIIPSRHSSLRYTVTLGSLAVVLAAGVVTFWWYSQAPAHPLYAVAADMTYAHVAPDIAAPASIWEQALTHVAAHMNLILAIWFAGALLFSLRIAGGIWYVTTLRRTSSPVGPGWQQPLETLVQRLDIHRVVTLATSVRLQAPVVLGYLKPVILVPAGMLAGLSTEQVETILLHELAHIRRHDYLVNLAQMLVEALYFFNPCIWALSAQVRTEREHCCDDAVVHYGGNARAYATALVQLEEVRLRQTGVALSLAENKHQLLTRIKRIMERSVQQNPGRERLVPALLLVVGLICAFWITFGQNTAEAQQQKKEQDTKHEATAGQEETAGQSQSFSVTADTVSVYDRKGKRTHHYERHTTITVGEDGQPHEVTTETYDGDDVPPGMRYFSYTHPVPVAPVDIAVFGSGVPPTAFEFVEPMELVPPVFDVVIPDIPSVEAFIQEFPPIPDIIIDSIPPIRDYRTEADMQAMQEAILDKMKGKFGDFYGEHQVELEKLMAEVQAEMANAQASLRAADAELQRDMLKRTREYVYRDKVRRDAEHGKRMAELQRDMQSHRDAVRKHQEAVRIQQDIVREEHAKVQVMHKELERYHAALRDRLVKDGYLKNKDDMFELHESDTEMTVNGKKVKEKDFTEYRKLRKKYVEDK